jgi:hypothetical protein
MAGMSSAQAPVAAVAILALTIAAAPVPAASMPETSQRADAPAKRIHSARYVAGTRTACGRRAKGRADHYLTDAESKSVDEAVAKFEGRRGMTRAKFQNFCFRNFKEQAD